MIKRKRLNLMNKEKKMYHTEKIERKKEFEMRLADTKLLHFSSMGGYLFNWAGELRAGE